MAWIEFTQYLAAAYLLYFGINVVIDLLRSKGNPAMQDGNEILEFSEPFETTIIEDKNPNLNKSKETVSHEGNNARNKPDDNQEQLVNKENINVSSGGVTNISKIFELAQNDAIEVKKKIVY